MAHRTAMIDVGGGFRAIYGAGVMDRMLEDGISVDHCYGVSAGSANMVSFIAKQHGRNHTFYTQYAFRKEYASFDSYVKNHNFANLDYVYSTLSNHDGEIRLTTRLSKPTRPVSPWLRATPKTAPRSISANPTWATTISTS